MQESMDPQESEIGSADLDLRSGWVGKADVAQVQISALRATTWHLLAAGLHLGHAIQQLEDPL